MKQPDRETRCPKCGGAPTDDSALRHDLSDLGYLHDDQSYKCSDCGHSYTHGVPVGECELDAHDLWCDVCDLGFMRVHRVAPMNSHVTLHLKCHHHHEFPCPECRFTVAADGAVLTKEGELYCPHCDGKLSFDEVPYCFYFTQTTREVDDECALIGYPDITGSTADADPYGYVEHEDVADWWDPITYFTHVNGEPPWDADLPETVPEPYDEYDGGELPVCGEIVCIRHGVGTVECPALRVL